MRRVAAALAVVLGACLTSGLGASSAAMASTAITVQGAVSCADHALVGVWVQSSGGGSRFAGWGKSSSGGYDGVFSTTITTALPTTLQLHVGCGGSTATWWSDNWTPGKSVGGSVTLEALCNEGTRQPAGGANSRCAYTTTGGEASAISWAEGQMAHNPSGYYLKCLKFAFDAYELSSSGHTNLHAMISPQPSSWNNTYPVQIWGHFNHGVTGGGTPPPGALVFWKASNGQVVDSHAAVSIGGGYVISTAYNGNPDIHKATMSQFPGAIELGWWLPA